MCEVIQGLRLICGMDIGQQEGKDGVARTSLGIHTIRKHRISQVKFVPTEGATTSVSSQFVSTITQ